MNIFGKKDIGMADMNGILALNRSRFFWSERNQGAYTCGNPESYYLRGSDPENASYDTGNNKVITVSGLNGELKYLTIFKPSFYGDNIPGVWVHKDRIYAKKYGFSLVRDGGKTYLPDYEGPIRTDLIECVIPMTQYRLEGLAAYAIAFAPLSADGGVRLRGAYYLLYLTNDSQKPQCGQVIPPDLGPFHLDNGETNSIDRVQVDVREADGLTHQKAIAFSLAPGESRLFPVWLSVYGEDAFDEVNKGAIWWLAQTLQYYRGLTGQLTFPENPLFEEFIVRTLCQCQMCIGMDQTGKLAGSSWGTNPTTYQIWMKDMYYSMLPLAQADPELFKAGVKWFGEYGVRPEGWHFEGGVKHSLSNSLSSVVMAGRYYAATGDAGFFKRNTILVETLTSILDKILLSRTREDVWLFPSIWISDGLTMGDFHTGSNIVAWAALSSFARVLREALGLEEKAATYEAVAEKVKEAILTLCVTGEGPFGEQFTEGCGKGSEDFQHQMQADSLEEFHQKNGSFGVQFYEFYNHTGDEPYLVHDGEETDTTLLSFYGMVPYDHPTYKNYTRFAMTEHNRFYCPVSRGILWEDCTDSTFPGYITGMANVVDRESFSEYFEPIAHLADLDGSIWWWPYKHKAKDHSDMQRVPGKCGWAAGTLLAMIWHDIMGVRYDGAARCLEVEPLNIAGPFEWEKARLGGGEFHISYEGNAVRVKNLNVFSVTARISLEGERLESCGSIIESEEALFLGKVRRKIQRLLLPGETLRVAVR